MDDHNKSNNDCNYQTRDTLILCHDIDIQSSNVDAFLIVEIFGVAPLWTGGRRVRHCFHWWHEYRSRDGFGMLNSLVHVSFLHQ